MTVYEVSQRFTGTSFQLGFCEGWSASEGMFILVRPFTRFLVHSPKGPVECRGDWTHRTALLESAYAIHQIARQSWMDLQIADLIRAMDLCSECSMDLPVNGYSRLTIL